MAPSFQVQQEVHFLRKEFKANKASNTVQNTNLNNPAATKEQIQQTIDTFPEAASCGYPFYIPQDQKSKLIDKLHKTQSTEERKFILQNALEYKSPQSTCNVH